MARKNRSQPKSKFLKAFEKHLPAFKRGLTKNIPPYFKEVDLSKIVPDPTVREDILLVRVKTKTPWGSWETMCTRPGFKVKILTIEKGRRLSLQMHKYREEHWIVISGKGAAYYGDRVMPLEKGFYIRVYPGQKHRLQADLRTDLQLGAILDEKDIVRLEDDYGRQDDNRKLARVVRREAKKTARKNRK
jgi:mannose-6-phosphate isomerase-like protein (cupin superfamily)